jgi:crotonobetaine/carnitine-CoA ligase
MLWNMPERPDDADNPVRYSVGYCPDEIWDGFERRFGLRIGTTYALSECIMVAYAAVDDPVPRQWAGRPNADIEVRILDDTDVEVPAGEVGEICARPLRPNVMFSGYYNDPEATAAAFRNLWFHTGDLGRMSPEGYLAFVDRKADYVRRLGENISTYELEQAILLHPAVVEVAVHAVPSDLGEDEVKAVVMRMPGTTIDPDELFAFCAGHMPRYAVPRYLEIVDQLPRSPVGRVQKFTLRQRGVTPETVDRLS